MFKIACLTLLVVLTGCATTSPPRQNSSCIPGDPSGNQRCQALTYQQAR